MKITATHSSRKLDVSALSSFGKAHRILSIIEPVQCNVAAIWIKINAESLITEGLGLGSIA